MTEHSTLGVGAPTGLVDELRPPLPPLQMLAFDRWEGIDNIAHLSSAALKDWKQVTAAIHDAIPARRAFDELEAQDARRLKNNDAHLAAEMARDPKSPLGAEAPNHHGKWVAQRAEAHAKAAEKLAQARAFMDAFRARLAASYAEDVIVKNTNDAARASQEVLPLLAQLQPIAERLDRAHSSASWAQAAKGGARVEWADHAHKQHPLSRALAQAVAHLDLQETA